MQEICCSTVYYSDCQNYGYIDSIKIVDKERFFAFLLWYPQLMVI